MAISQTEIREANCARPGIWRWLKVTSALVLLLVLIQAILAGRGLFISGREIDIHGEVANLTGLLVLIQVVLIFLAGVRGRFRMSLITSNVLLVLLVIVQFGLGYAGRNSVTAASLHVPNGVLIFGVATLIACLVWIGPSQSDRSV